MIPRIPKPRSCAARVAHHLALLLAVVLAVSIGLISLAQADQGQWTPAADWTHGNRDRYAVHMALLPGDGTHYHSRILWWHGENATTYLGRLWGWKTGNDGCEAFPGSSFDSLTVPLSGVDFFCAGNTALPDGRLLVMGGTDRVTTTYGELRSRIFTPGSCGAVATWSDPGSMTQARWYPMSTVLRDGRVLVTSGSMPTHQRMFGGFRDGSSPAIPTGDSLYRFTPVAGGRWGPAQKPAGDPNSGARPAPRAGHTAVDMNGVSGFFGQVYFGGRKSNGLASDETWLLTLEPNPLGADFLYTWDQEAVSGSRPFARSEHSAVAAPLDAMVVVYGGQDNSSNSLGDVWRLYPDAQGRPQWGPITVVGTGPSARYGHAAVYDITARTGATSETLKRMIVFGGTATGGAPNDVRVWELRFDHSTPDTATWRELPQAQRPGGGPGPGPRYWHRMVMDPLDHLDPFTNATGHAALLYGGALGGSAYSDSLWALWVFADSVWWEHKPVTVATGAPGARARHSAIYDPGHGEGVQNPGRLFIYGGETNGGPADHFVYAVDPWATSPSWIPWSDAGFSLSGHTALPDVGGSLARVPDLFDPATGQWQSPLSSSTLRQQFYPPTFLVPGAGSGASRVVTVAYDTTYWLDVPASGAAGAWQRLTYGALGFNPQTGVAYRPGHLMLTGGADNALNVVGRTVTLDAASMSNNWVASGDMLPREDHDLVLLPTGTVLVLGGLSRYVEGDSAAVTAAAQRWPQLWYPDSNGVGVWSDTVNASSRLTRQPILREDHSTTILLPDGRILSASGEFTAHRDSADIFCPPYLFKADGVTLATRPVIRDAPPCIGWGEGFTVAVADADTAHIQSACLIRPGAITHAVDHNQRFVPLNFSAHGYPARLEVTAPASPDSAPPGFYLLFVLGSSDGAEVPSIARWIRIVDNGMSSGPDQGPPAPLSDFAVDAVSQNSVYLTWTATADDGDDPASGPACEFDLRKAYSAINTEAKWDVAIALCGEPVPGPVGTAHDYLASGLSACTWYDFAIRARDEELNSSVLDSTNRVFARTLMCGGGGGGSYAARPVQRDAALRATSGALVVETDRSVGGGWQLTLRAVGSTEGLEGASDGVSIQQRSPAGVWRTLSSFTPGAEEPSLGLCALRERGRAIVAGDFGLQQVAGTFTAEGTAYALASAVHSSLGTLDVATLAAGGGEALAVGDTLTLRYAPAASTDSTASGWYLLAGRGLLVSATRQRRATEGGAALPLRFALHQNGPNPFAAATTIRFDLPAGAMVRLEVFDVAGRRVAMLANHYFPPGYQAVEWDRRTPSGLAAGAGVYFYRIEAGPLRDRKKMVILP
jgi:hypothetical protein